MDNESDWGFHYNNKNRTKNISKATADSMWDGAADGNASGTADAFAKGYADGHTKGSLDAYGKGYADGRTIDSRN